MGVEVVTGVDIVGVGIDAVGVEIDVVGVEIDVVCIGIDAVGKGEVLETDRELKRLLTSWGTVIIKTKKHIPEKIIISSLRLFIFDLNRLTRFVLPSLD